MLGLFGWGVLSLAGPVGAQGPDKNTERADRVRALQRQIIDLEAIGRARALQARGVKPALRPAVKANDNVEHFAPVTAKFVRFTVLATVSGDEPCLHLLDIYGPDSSANLTTGARLTASSIWPGHLGDFKGGKYSKGWCWVAKERGKGWLQVELPAPAKIARIVWARDTANRHHDRIPTVYNIEASEDGRAWRTVATGKDRVAPGPGPVVFRSALVKALDPGQQKKRRELLDELRKLGAPAPNEIRSGPQVGEGVNGGFVSLFVNGEHGHAGKRRCPV
jgi:hypothetical protein